MNLYQFWNSGKKSLEETKEFLTGPGQKLKTGDILEDAVFAPEGEISKYLIDLAMKRKIDLKSGWNDAHAAGISGRLTDLEKAIKRKADLNREISDSTRCDVRGSRPIHLAAWLNHVPLLEALIREGVPVDSPGENGISPLMIALQKGSNEAACFLIRAGSDVNHRETLRNESPLFAVSDAITGETLDLLVEKGADLSAGDSQGYPVAAGLIATNSLKAFYYLSEKHSLPVMCENKTSLLFCALKFYENSFGYKEEYRKPFDDLLDFLINHEKIDLNGRYVHHRESISEPSRETTALDVALEENSPRVVQFLLDRGARLPEDFDPRPFLEFASYIPQKIALLGESAPEPSAYAAQLISITLQSPEEEKEPARELMNELFSHPQFKDFRDKNGVDLFFKYVSAACVAYNAPLLDMKWVEAFLEARCPLDLSYDAEKVDEISEINYYFGTFLKRQSYTLPQLLKDLCDQRMGSAGNDDTVEQTLALVEARTGEKTEELFTGRGFGFDDDAYGVLLYGLAYKKLTFEILVNLSRLCEKRELTLAPVGDLSRPGEVGEYTYSCVIGSMAASAAAWQGPGKVKKTAVATARQAWQEIPGEVLAEVEKITGKKPEPEEPGLYLVASGPLSSVFFAAGTLKEQKETGEDRFFRGADMEQEPHEKGVQGTEIAFAEEWEERVDEKKIPGNKRLFLVPRYD